MGLRLYLRTSPPQNATLVQSFINLCRFGALFVGIADIEAFLLFREQWWVHNVNERSVYVCKHQVKQRKLKGIFSFFVIKKRKYPLNPKREKTYSFRWFILTFEIFHTIGAFRLCSMTGFLLFSGWWVTYERSIFVRKYQASASGRHLKIVLGSRLRLADSNAFAFAENPWNTSNALSVIKCFTVWQQHTP